MGEPVIKKNVQKKAVDLAPVPKADFSKMRFDIVLVVGITPVVEMPPSGVGRSSGIGVSASCKCAVRAHLAPGGKTGGDIFLPSDGGVDRRAYAFPVQGDDHFSEQIAAFECR